MNCLCLLPSSPQRLHLQQLQSIWHRYWRSRPRPHRPCPTYGVSPAENPQLAPFLSFPLLLLLPPTKSLRHVTRHTVEAEQEEGRTCAWNMHTAADDAVDDDHVAAGIRQHSRADIHTQTQTDLNRRRQDLSVEAAGSGSDFDEYDHDTHGVDKHSAAVHIHCGAIPAEYRSRREHLGNDNWSEMGTAGHNRMQWPAAAAAAAAAEIAVTVRSSEVDSRRNVGTGSGRSREADEAVEEGDRHSRTRQIRTSDSLRRDNLEQEAEVQDHPRGCGCDALH